MVVHDSRIDSWKSPMEKLHGSWIKCNTLNMDGLQDMRQVGAMKKATRTV